MLKYADISINKMALTRLEDFETGRVVRFLVPRIIDDETTQNLGRELFNYVETQAPNSGRRGDCCLSFAGVDFLSAATLGKFIILDKKLKARGQSTLALACVPPEIYEVFKITKLDHLFEFYKDVQEYLSRSPQ